MPRNATAARSPDATNAISHEARGRRIAHGAVGADRALGSTPVPVDEGDALERGGLPPPCLPAMASPHPPR